MTETLPELADELDAVALSIERHEQSRAGLRIRDIADKLRAYPVRDGHPVPPYGYVPDEPQLPYIAGPDTGPFGEQLDD